MVVPKKHFPSDTNFGIIKKTAKVNYDFAIFL